MKTLSAANQANISKRISDYAVKIDLPNQSKKWSYGVASGYDPIVTNMSTITQSIDPYGGLGQYGDFSFSIHKEPTQIIETDALDNEPVTVNIAFGSDPDIPMWAGVVDNWSYSKGVLTINCISKLVLKGTQLPIQQINSTNYSTFNILEKQDGKWVPFTIGTANKAFALLGDIGQNHKIAFLLNAPVSGHVAIGSMPNGTSVPIFYLPDPGGFFWEDDLSQESSSDNTSGYMQFVEKSTLNIRAKLTGFESEWRTGGGLVAGTDEELGINQDTSDFALLDNPAGDGVIATGEYRMRLPEIGIGYSNRVIGVWHYGKYEKEQAINHGSRTSEQFHGGFEIVEGTAASGSELDQIISTTSFNNVDGGDGEKDNPISMTDYNAVWGDDAVNQNDTGFSASKLSGKYFNVVCTEEDLSDSTDDSDYFRLYYVGILPVAVIQATQLDGFYTDASGYDDDASGTYTGSANSLIETPVDVVYFILGEIFGHTGFNTSSVTTARTAFGSYIIAGQFLDLISGEEALIEIISNSRMSAFIDHEDNWKFKHWDLPGATPDKTFKQNLGDFSGDEIEFIGQSPSENVYNQFEILYSWNQAFGKYDNTLVLDENSGGAIGTWLTDSQNDYNITRKLIVEAKWINDADTATSYGNYLIYRYADRKHVAKFMTYINGADLELLDRIKLEHQDITDTNADHTYEIYSIETDLINGTIAYESMEASASHAALSDPT